MPVQNSNFKICARPDLTINLLKRLILTTFNTILCQKEQLTYLLCIRRLLVRKHLLITPKKSKLKIFHRNVCLSKKVLFRKLPVQKTGRTGPG